MEFLEKALQKCNQHESTEVLKQLINGRLGHNYDTILKSKSAVKECAKTRDYSFKVAAACIDDTSGCNLKCFGLSNKGIDSFNCALNYFSDSIEL